MRASEVLAAFAHKVCFGLRRPQKQALAMGLNCILPVTTVVVLRGEGGGRRGGTGGGGSAALCPFFDLRSH